MQQWFLERPTLMRWTNKTYSFIHIPGTILYLIILYHLTIARPRHKLLQEEEYRDKLNGDRPITSKNWRDRAPAFGPPIYERRRRTMAMCNLLAFIVFTFWPCMPPRLLSDPTYMGENSEEAKGYGFVDTVHGEDGDSSVWTTNRFCNQYGECPSSVKSVGCDEPGVEKADFHLLISRHAVPSLWILVPYWFDHRRCPTPTQQAQVGSLLWRPSHCNYWCGHGVPGRHSDRHRGDG